MKAKTTSIDTDAMVSAEDLCLPTTRGPSSIHCSAEI